MNSEEEIQISDLITTLRLPNIIFQEQHSIIRIYHTLSLA